MFSNEFRNEIVKLNKLKFKVKYYFTKCNKSKFAHVQKIQTNSSMVSDDHQHLNQKSSATTTIAMEKSRTLSSASNQSRHSNQSQNSNQSQGSSVLKNLSKKLNFKSWFNSPKLGRPSSQSTLKNIRKNSYVLNQNISDQMKHSLSEPTLNEIIFNKQFISQVVCQGFPYTIYFIF